MEIVKQDSAIEAAAYLAGRMNYYLSVKHGAVYVALSGGNTPRDIFAEWKRTFKTSIDWRRLVFFWVDERCVPPDSNESNYGVAKRLFFDDLLDQSINLYPVDGTHDPGKEVERLNALACSILPHRNGLPVFDIIMLGMGADGHTASLFPGQLDQFLARQAYITTLHPDTGQQRVTLTGATINNAEERVFVVTGQEKSAIINEIATMTGDWESYPAAHVALRSTTWLVIP